MEKYRNDPLVYHGKLKAKWAVAMLNAADFFAQHFSEITIPLLLVHGDADQLVNIASSQFGYDTASSADKTFEVFKDGFHELFNDLERDRFLSLLVKWLDQRFDKVDSSGAGEGTAVEEGQPPKDVPVVGDPPQDIPPEDESPKEAGVEEESSTKNAGPAEGEPPTDPPTEGEPPEDEVAPEESQPSEQVPATEGDTAGEDGGEQDTEDNQ